MRSRMLLVSYSTSSCKILYSFSFTTANKTTGGAVTLFLLCMLLKRLRRRCVQTVHFTRIRNNDDHIKTTKTPPTTSTTWYKHFPQKHHHRNNPLRRPPLVHRTKLCVSCDSPISFILHRHVRCCCYILRSCWHDQQC